MVTTSMFCYCKTWRKCRPLLGQNLHLMKFVCVLSVEGSLVSYDVTKKTDTKYTAALRSNSGKRDDVPEEMALEKDGIDWKANPWNDMVAKGIIQAIEAGDQ